MNKQDIDNRFQFHPAQTSEKVAAHGSARSILWIAANQLDNLIPDGREKSIVMTKLEEAMFWANAALARPKLDIPSEDRPLRMKVGRDGSISEVAGGPLEEPVKTGPTICGCEVGTEIWDAKGCSACMHGTHPTWRCGVPLK